MNHLNSILLEGYLLADPRVVVTAPEGESWGSMVKFDIASHKFYMSGEGEKKDDALIISCIAFGDLAEKILPLLKCGMQARVLGRLRCSRWQTREGDERKNFEIVCQHVEFRRKASGKAEEEFHLEDEEKVGENVSESVFEYEFF